MTNLKWEPCAVLYTPSPRKLPAIRVGTQIATNKLEETNHKTFSTAESASPRVGQKERVFRKTIEIIERPAQRLTVQKQFLKPRTTINISRKGSIVRERCKQLMEVLWDLGYREQITRRDLSYLITRYIGGDRGTKRAYLGHNGQRKPFRRHEGYLEQLGYVRRRHGGLAFILNHERVPLHYHYVESLGPPTAPPSQHSECLAVKGNMEKISLSLGESEREGANGSVEPIAPTTNENKQQQHTMRERNFQVNTNNAKTERETTPEASRRGG